VPPPLVRIVEPALPRPLFLELSRAVRALGRTGLRTTYRTTFWFDLASPPSALPERAAEVVRARLGAALGRAPRALRIAGVEWWLSRARPEAPGVDFHRDRDEARFARTGEPRHPALTCVLFLSAVPGGHLAVTAQAPDPGNPALAPLPLDADLVRPAPNRLALFRGDLTHGVLDHRGEIPGSARARAGSRGGRLRLALVLNFWRARPEGVPAFAGARPRRYAALDVPAPASPRRPAPTYRRRPALAPTGR
jgi:hypothetical protein